MLGSDRFSLLYVTREKYPNHRVDLTQLYSAGIAGRGHRIDWVMQSEHAGPTRLEQLGQGERVFVGAAGSGKGVPGKATNQMRGLLHDLRVWRIARRGDYDCIQVRDRFFASLVGLLAARFCRIPFFYYMSFPFPEADLYRVAEAGKNMPLIDRLFYSLRGRWASLLLYKIILPQSEHIFVQSEKMKQNIAAKGISEDKMTPIPMGISLNEIKSERVDAVHDERLSNRSVVVYVGTLVRVRRMEFLIEAFKSVRERVPHALLVLVGDAKQQDMQFLRDEVSRHGLTEHVLFTGWLPMQQAWNYIRAAKVCVCPLHPNPILDAGTPTKVVEYLALGKPVVANDHPDQGKVLAESGAGLAVAYDSAAFADAIVQLLSDEEKAEAMGARGVDYVKKHRSYESLSEDLEACYLQLLSRKKPEFMRGVWP